VKFFHYEILYKQRQYVLNNANYTNIEQYLKRLINMLHRVNIFLISLSISPLSVMNQAVRPTSRSGVDNAPRV